MIHVLPRIPPPDFLPYHDSWFQYCSSPESPLTEAEKASVRICFVGALESSPDLKKESVSHANSPAHAMYCLHHAPLPTPCATAQCHVPLPVG